MNTVFSVEPERKLSVYRNTQTAKNHNTGTEGQNGEKQDSLSISAAGLELSREQEQDPMNAAIKEAYEQWKADKAEQKMYEDQAKASDEAADAFKDMAKMMEVARRIANGDRVPSKDEQKLMEFNSKLYQAAKSAAMMSRNKKPKDYDTLFEEEKKSEEDQTGEAEETAAPAAEGGAEAAPQTAESSGEVTSDITSVS